MEALRLVGGLHDVVRAPPLARAAAALSAWVRQEGGFQVGLAAEAVAAWSLLAAGHW